MECDLVEETNRHLLLDIRPLKNLRELFEGDQVILILISLQNGPLCNGDELLSADVSTNHHRQNCQQLFLGDLIITIQVVHPECKVEFLHPGVQFVLFNIFLDWSEMSQNANKVLEVYFIIIAIFAFMEEGVDDPVPEGVDGELRDPEEVLPVEVALALLVQAGEPAVQPLDLVGGEPSLGLDSGDVLSLKL